MLDNVVTETETHNVDGSWSLSNGKSAADMGWKTDGLFKNEASVALQLNYTYDPTTGRLTSVQQKAGTGVSISTTATATRREPGGADL